MKIYDFSFKNEAIWMVILSLAPLVIGFLILVTVGFLRR
jgi:hypothetical protein